MVWRNSFLMGAAFCLGLLFMFACESRSYEERELLHRLSKIDKAAADAFLPTVGTEYERAMRDLDRLADRGEPIDSMSAGEYRVVFRKRVSGILLKHWEKIAAREKKAARLPGNRSDTKWNRDNRARLKTMFSSLVDPDVRKRWEQLENERSQIEGAQGADELAQAIEAGRGKLLYWSEGVDDSDLTKCVLAVVQPLAAQQQWLKLKKPPAEEVRAVAWGTLIIRAKLEYAEYKDLHKPGAKPIRSTIPISLDLAAIPHWPEPQNLPKEWRIRVTTGSPERIFDKRNDQVRLQMSRLALKAIRDLWSRGCADFQKQVDPSP